MDVATYYYNSGGRSARGNWFIQNIPLMAKKINLTRNFQVFSYDQRTDSFTQRERSTFNRYIRQTIYDKCQYTGDQEEKEQSDKEGKNISNDTNVIQETESNKKEKEGKDRDHIN